ncbi:MAG: radical SAM protein [Candidatus Omnitrophica bacterium]|nr:radical SAM protein [Candidatus Omnitrophota bacterium]
MINEFRDVFGFSNKKIESGLKDNAILSLEIEFESKCNLRCVYCYAGRDFLRRNELEIEEMFDVISQAKALGAQKIIYLGAGEPLLDPKLIDIVKYVHKLKMEHILFTNATLINEKTAQLFYDNNLTVIVTYNSMKPEVYDWLAGLNGAHASMQRGLEFLYEVGYPDNNHVLGIESVVCQQNIDEIPSLWRWARERKILPYVECLTHVGRVNGRKDILVKKEETQKVFETLAKIDADEYGLYWKPHPPIAGFACKRHLYSCLINSQGYVLPCVGVDIKMGNIRKEKLKNILKNNKTYNDLRNIRKKVKGLCKTCDLNDECYGCRGTAYALTGDYLESDPTCWRAKK